MGREERGLEWRNKKIIVATAHQLVIFAHVAASAGGAKRTSQKVILCGSIVRNNCSTPKYYVFIKCVNLYNPYGNF